jgi:hypothetical protein
MSNLLQKIQTELEEKHRLQQQYSLLCQIEEIATAPETGELAEAMANLERIELYYLSA